MSIWHVGDTVKSLVWGNREATVSQEFGEYNAALADWYQYAADWGYPAGTHIAYDVAMERNTPIYSPVDGVVVASGPSDSYRPNPVAVETADDPATPEDDRYRIWFGHLWSDTVSVGDTVHVGQQVGYSGEQTIAGTMTPDGSGPHLHFELLSLGSHTAVDPAPLLEGAAGALQPGDVTGGAPAPGGDTGLADSIAGAVKGAAPRVGLFVVGGAAALLGLGMVFPAVANAVPAVRAVNVVRSVAHAR